VKTETVSFCRSCCVCWWYENLWRNPLLI